MRRILIVLVAMLVALVPAVASAQEAEHDGGFVLRISGDYRLAAGEELNNLVVIDGNATIDGHVNESMLVINGDALVRGSIGGDITMIRGDLTLASGSTVDNVSLIRGHIDEQAGSVRTGDLSRTSWVFITGFGIALAALIVVGSTLALMLAGVVFAAVGGKQLTETAQLLGEKPGHTIGFGFIVAIGLPVVAAIAIATIVGIPIGIGMLLLVAPALMLLGYIVAGTWLGTLILRQPETPKAHPYTETLLGLLVLQLGLLIPGIGGAAFILLGLWGTGAISYKSWRSLRSGRPEKPAATATPAAPAAPTGGMQPT